MSISNIMQAVKEPVLAVAKPLAYVTAGGLSGTAFCVVAELIGQAISSSDTSSYNAYLPSDSQITNSFLADYSMGNSVVGGPIAGMITGLAIYTPRL